MDYKPLKILFYSDKENFNTEYDKRFNLCSTLKTDLKIAF